MLLMASHETRNSNLLNAISRDFDTVANSGNPFDADYSQTRRQFEPLLEDVPATLQERAWTSPIWYTPGS